MTLLVIPLKRKNPEADAFRNKTQKQNRRPVLWKKGPRRRTPRLFLQDPTRFLTIYVVYYAMYRTIKIKHSTLLRSKHTENIMCIPMILRRQVLSLYVFWYMS